MFDSYKKLIENLDTLILKVVTIIQPNKHLNKVKKKKNLS